MGIRENPERRKRFITLLSGVPEVTVTRSVRGTMTCFAEVSESMNTDGIMSRSPSSMMSDSLALSTRSRS